MGHDEIISRQGPDLRRPLLTGGLLPRSKDFLPKVDEFINYNHELLGCPVNYMTAGVIFAVGVALGKKVSIKIPDYTNYANLYMAVVGRSGANKSTPISRCLQPLIDLDRQLWEKYSQAKKEVEEANREIAKANRRSKAAPQPMKPQPVEYSIYIEDATPEKRNATLAAIDSTDLGLMVYFDELAGLFKQFGRYNNSSELQDLLKLYDCKTLKVSRKSEETIRAERPCLSIIGTIQTNVLKDTFADKSMRNNGFNQRWLFVFPESNEVPQAEVKEEDPTQNTWWASFIESIFKMQGKRQITLSKKALTIYLAWKNALTDEINSLGRTDESQTDDSINYSLSTLSKACIFCLRLALACHFLTRFADSNSINEAEMKYAIKLSEYFIKTAEQVQDLLEGPVEPNKGLILLTAWLEAQKKGMTQKQFAESQGVTPAYVSKVIKQYRGKMK